jgi:hypothetical protein
MSEDNSVPPEVKSELPVDDLIGLMREIKEHLALAGMFESIGRELFPRGDVSGNYFESLTEQKFRLALSNGCLFAKDRQGPVGDVFTLWIAVKHPQWLDQWYCCSDWNHLRIACEEIVDWIDDLAKGKPEPEHPDKLERAWLVFFYYGLGLDESSKPVRDTPSGLLKRIEDAYEEQFYRQQQKRFRVLQPRQRLAFKRRLEYYVRQTSDDWVGQVNFRTPNEEYEEYLAFKVSARRYPKVVYYTVSRADHPKNRNLRRWKSWSQSQKT